MKRIICIFTVIGFFLVLLMACGLDGDTSANSNQQEGKKIITISTGSMGVEKDITYELVNKYNSQNEEVFVKIIEVPDIVNDRLGFYHQFFQSKNPELDIFQVDVIWTGDLAKHFVDLYQYGANEWIEDHFPAIIKNNTVDGALTSMPMFTDAGLLYYRKDLLEKYDLAVPQTWNELVKYAKMIQEGERAEGNQDFYGYVWQGNAYEGLTCNALEWIASNEGGTIVDEEGRVTINNENALEMLDFATEWIGTISPLNVTSMTEEGSRIVWQNGNAAFMRNWPYAYALGNEKESPIRGKFGITSIPSGKGKSSSTLGGWQLAVSKYSKHPQEAADFVFFMTSEESQKTRALRGSFNPTIISLYEDPDILEKYPFFQELQYVFLNSVARPSTITSPKYDEISASFYFYIHHALMKRISSQEALERIEREIESILDSLEK